MFIINTFSTCFGASLCPSSGQQRPYVTARGVLRWFCWMWLVEVVGRCIVGCEQCEGYCSIRSIVNAPRYVPNTILHTDLQIPTVKVEITNFSTKYREKLITHSNELIPALLDDEEPRRLKCFKPTELTIRFS